MLIRFVALGLVTTLLSCRGADGTPPGDEAASDKKRLVASAPPEELAAGVRGNTTFALDLYKELAGRGNGNLFLSPLSVSVALSMAYAGAEGSTEEAFAEVLRSGLSEASHHRVMNDLDAQLTSRGKDAKGADGQPFRLTTANQLFAQRGYPVEAPFLDTLALEYGASVRLLDFTKEPEPSREAINAWVAAKTEDRIEDLLSPGVIKNDTRLVLVNAIYFNASWATPFEASATRRGDFQLLDGSKKSVELMRNPELATRAAQVDGTEIFELAYDGRELSLLVLMPPAGSFESFERALTTDTLAQHLDALRGAQLELSFPKFEIRSKADLKTPLTTLGLGVAFSDDADFSGITREERLLIADVVHQAFVKVNESGTEAAAATGVVFGPTSVPVTRPVVVDRPFVFAIRDHATGAIVFLGRVTEP